MYEYYEPELKEDLEGGWGGFAPVQLHLISTVKYRFE